MINDNENARTFNILPGPKMGVLTLEYLEKLIGVVGKYDIPLLKMTSAQRLAIAGHSPAAVEHIWQDMGQPAGPRKPAGIHYIQACPGVRWCKYGRQDSLALGEKIEQALIDMALPAKTKIGISGCPFNCCESYVRDLGIFGKKKGWTLLFGGNGGGCPRIADIIGEDLDDDQAIALARKCLTFYGDNARRLERTARFMRRTTAEKFKAAVLM